MSRLISVRIAHQLGRDEARRRLQAGIADARTRFGDKVSQIEEAWQGDHLDFKVAALGQSIAGTMDVAEDHVQLEFSLPALLGMLGGKIKSYLQASGTRLLGKS